MIENVLDENLKYDILAVSTFQPAVLSQIFYCKAKYSHSNYFTFKVSYIHITLHIKTHCIQALLKTV